jgi:acyl carrier protein
VLRTLAEAGALPSMFQGLVQTGVGRSGGITSPRGSQLARRLAGLSEDERNQVVLDVVCTHVATVLGHATPDTVDRDRGFFDLGFDSLTAVELRNRLMVDTGIRLPATAVFDYPTARSIASYLAVECFSDTSKAAGSESGEAEIRQALAAIPLDRFRQAGIMDILLELAGFDANYSEPSPEDRTTAIAAMDTDELVQMALSQ